MGRSQSGRFLYNLLWIYYNPTAAAAFFQEGAGAIFGEENAGSVDGAAHEDMACPAFFCREEKERTPCHKWGRSRWTSGGLFVFFFQHKEPHPVIKHSAQPMRPTFRKSVVCSLISYSKPSLLEAVCPEMLANTHGIRYNRYDTLEKQKIR